MRGNGILPDRRGGLRQRTVIFAIIEKALP
jgi:hypothetical protein